MKRFFFIGFLWLLCACAQKKGLLGGPEDQTSPTLIKSSPAHEETQVQTQKINLYYQEEVQFKNAQTEIVFSPPLKYPAEYKNKGHLLEILFTDTLQKNTTYTVDLGKSVVDITENNPIDSAQTLVFSSGSSIDQGQLSGQVKDALSGERAQKAWILLHLATADSQVQKTAPLFLQKTDSAGFYHFKNIPNTSFRAYALVDGNSNLRYDLPTEKLAFSNIIQITDSAQTLDFELFDELEPNKETQILKKEYQHPGFIQLIFSDSVRDVKLNNQVAFIDSSAKDTIVFSIHPANILLGTWVVFSWNKKQSDSLFIPENPTYRPLSIQTAAIKKWDYDLVLTSSYPMLAIDSNHIQWMGDSTLTSPSWFISPQNPYQALAKAFWKEDVSYTCILAPGAIQWVADTTLKDTIKLRFQTDRARQYVNINTLIQGHDSSQMHILQLLNTEKIVVQEIYGAMSRATFKQVKAGTYYLRLIEDLNQNKRWDVGRLHGHISSEKIYFYTEKLELQEGFDLDFIWKIKR